MRPGDPRDLWRGCGVTLVEVGLRSEPGRLTLHINSANPTVTTASPEFISAADGAGGWEGQAWDREIEVPVTTLDALIAAHGAPAFAKIDVEGFEDRCWRADPSRRRRCPSSSPRSSATWPSLPRPA